MSNVMLGLMVLGFVFLILVVMALFRWLRLKVGAAFFYRSDMRKENEKRLKRFNEALEISDRIERSILSLDNGVEILKEAKQRGFME